MTDSSSHEVHSLLGDTEWKTKGTAQGYKQGIYKVIQKSYRKVGRSCLGIRRDRSHVKHCIKEEACCGHVDTGVRGGVLCSGLQSCRGTSTKSGHLCLLLRLYKNLLREFPRVTFSRIHLRHVKLCDRPRGFPEPRSQVRRWPGSGVTDSEEGAGAEILRQLTC